MVGETLQKCAGTEQRDDNAPHPPQSNALFAAKPRNSEGDTYPYQPHPSPPADLKAGGVTGASLRNIPQDAKRLRSAKRDAEPLCMSEDVPERSPRHAPGFPVGVLDLVGLSTYRRPADQRWQQR